MLIRKLAIYEFWCRNILYLMLESLSIYCPNQKRFVETMLFWNSTAELPIEKIKARKEKKNEKRKKCGWNISVEMTDGGKICGHPNLPLIFSSTFFQLFDFPYICVFSLIRLHPIIIFSFANFRCSSNNLIFSSSSISLGNKGKEAGPKYSKVQSLFKYFLVLAWFVCFKICILKLHHWFKITEIFANLIGRLTFLNKVSRPIKFGIWTCACCCNVLARVVSHFVFIELFRVRILLQWNHPTADISNSGHTINSGQNILVPNVTIFLKLPPKSGHLSVTDKFFKTRWCPLFRGFTVFCCWFCINICLRWLIDIPGWLLRWASTAKRANLLSAHLM